MSNFYVDKDEITKEILAIQKREKVRQIAKRIDEIESQLKKSPEDWELKEQKNDLENEKQQLLDAGADPEYSRQRFGEIVLLINENLLKKPCFRSYSENWTEDFKSNAIYKIFKYINNFDPEKVSKVTGKKISSFAYLTQITYMAFVEVINKRKKDGNDIMENMIPLQDLKPEHMNTSKFNHESTYHEEEVDERFELIVNEDDLKDKTLFDILEKLRETDDKIRVIYPLNYTITLVEYDKIMGLKFDKLDIIKQKEVDQILENEDETCFAFTDEEFEDWGEWNNESVEDTE